MIARITRKSYRWSILAVALMVLLGCLALTNAQPTPAPKVEAAKPAPPSREQPTPMPDLASATYSWKLKSLNENKATFEDMRINATFEMMVGGSAHYALDKDQRAVEIRLIEADPEKSQAILGYGEQRMTKQLQSQTSTNVGSEFKVETTTDEEGHYVDKIDFPFVTDPRVIGRWVSVDFVNDPADYRPGENRWQKQWQGKGDLYLKDMIFRPNGRTNWAFTWTRGLVLCDNGDGKTASRYEIKTIDGQPIMFMEWKSGDYIVRHQKPCYYVLRQTSTDPGPEPQRIVDKIDYPFVNDPDVLGHWEAVDFVDEPGAFNPEQKKWQGAHYLKVLEFREGGKTRSQAGKQPAIKDAPWWPWTKGMLMHQNDKTASRYEIKQIGGQTYLFLEWKSGDYTIRHMKPKYYVFKKS